MNYFRKNSKNLLIIILIVLNLTIIASFLIQSYRLNQGFPSKMPITPDKAEMGMNRFFIEELELTNDQIKHFKQLQIEFQTKGRSTREKINQERLNFVKELSKDEPNSNKIESISNNIGLYHRDLKLLTSYYYLNMKEICNDDQKEKLKNVFLRLGSSPDLPPEFRRRMERRGFERRGSHRKGKNFENRYRNENNRRREFEKRRNSHINQ